MKLRLIFAFFFYFLFAASKLSLDFIIPYNTSVFQCIHSSGFTLVSLRAAFRQGVDPNGIQNINNARNAGL